MSPHGAAMDDLRNIHDHNGDIRITFPIQEEEEDKPKKPPGTSYVTSRLPSTQAAFDENHLRHDADEKPSLSERIKDACACSKRRMWKLLVTYIPLIKFIRYYKLKENAVTDIIGGLSVGTIHIPQALAFGQLASAKIENGLFCSFFPVLIYIFFGTSAHVSMGTSAVICILTAATIDREGIIWASDKPWLMDQVANGTRLDDLPEYQDFKEEMAMAVSLVTGLMMMAMGFLKLGFITAYLSDSFFAAFTSAAAVHIGTSQIPPILGIKIQRYAGIGKIVKSYIAIFSEIENTNIAALIIAVICCVVIWFVKDCINERFKSKLFAPIPIELFIVIFGTIASYFGNFREEFGIKVVGNIPTGISAPYVPTEGLKLASGYVVDCFVMAVLIFAYTIAIAKICAKKHNYEVDDSQEMLAYGLCNAGSAFFRCIPSCVAPPRSMVASSMNVKSTLNGIACSALMLLLILIITRLFTELPSCVLAAIIFIALQKLFMQILDFRKYWRINKFDFVIWFFTFFSTVFLDIDVGLGIGVGVSLVTIVFQTQFSRGYKIGYTKTDPHPVNHKRYRDSSEIPGIKIFRYLSSLYFANAEIFRSTLYDCTVNPRKLLKGLKKREKRLKKMEMDKLLSQVLNTPIEPPGAKVELTKTSSMPDLNAAIPLVDFKSDPDLTVLPALTLVDELTQQSLPTAALDLAIPTSSEPTQNNNPGVEIIDDSRLIIPAVRRVRLPSVDRPPFIIMHGNAPLFLDDTGVHTRFDDANSARETSRKVSRGALKRAESSVSLYSINFDDYTEDPDDGDEFISDEKIRRMRKIHHVIIDCTPINYMDASGCNVLSHIYTEYSHVNIQVYLAGCNAYVRETMKHGGVFDKIPLDNVFVDLQDAVSFAKPQKPQPIKREDIVDFTEEEAIEESHIVNI